MWSPPHSTIRCGCSTMRSTLMMIDMNGPDIDAVDKVKVLMLERLSMRGRITRSGCRQGAVKRPRDDVVFNDFIKHDFIPEGGGQVASGSAFLPDPVALETVVLTLEREQNERDVLEALGEYKCDAGMSVENVAAVVNIKTLKRRFIAQKFSTGLAVGVVKSVEKKKSVAGQFPVKYKS